MESAPFTPLQKYMVMVDGLNLICGSRMSGSNGGQDTHEGGVVAVDDRRADAGKDRPAGPRSGWSVD